MEILVEACRILFPGSGFQSSELPAWQKVIAYWVLPGMMIAMVINNDNDDVDGGSVGEDKRQLSSFFLRHSQTSWSYRHALIESYMRQV